MDYFVKKKTAGSYRALLRKVSSELGLAKGSFDIRFNPGGDAVSGEVTLHADSLYIQASSDMKQLGVLVRTCKSRKDYTGGPNNWVPLALLQDPAAFADRVRRIIGGPSTGNHNADRTRAAA